MKKTSIVLLEHVYPSGVVLIGNWGGNEINEVCQVTPALGKSGLGGPMYVVDYKGYLFHLAESFIDGTRARWATPEEEQRAQFGYRLEKLL